jgi:hypothetical protein
MGQESMAYLHICQRGLARILAPITALQEYLTELQQTHQCCENLRQRLMHLELCNDIQLLQQLTDKYEKGRRFAASFPFMA